MTTLKLFLNIFFSVALWSATSCSAKSHFTESCRQLESTRCEVLGQCPNNVIGGVESCRRFYDEQCTRGSQNPVKEPLADELTACLQAIRSSCEIAQSPTRAPECGFLITNKTLSISTSDASMSDALSPSDASSQ